MACGMSLPLGLVAGYVAGFREYSLLQVSLVATPIIYFLLIFVVGLIVPLQPILLDNKTEKNSS
jgi:hypothetical protein